MEADRYLHSRIETDGEKTKTTTKSFKLLYLVFSIFVVNDRAVKYEDKIWIEVAGCMKVGLLVI